jgi:hypothetical protein
MESDMVMVNLIWFTMTPTILFSGSWLLAHDWDPAA